MAVHTSSASIEATSSPAESTNDKDTFTLENILGSNHDAVEHPRLKESDADGATNPAEGWDEESVSRPAAEGFCVECEGASSIGSARAHRVEAHPWDADQPAQVVCDKCADKYCEVCFAAQHRKGSRKTHVAKPIASIAKSKNGVAEDVKAKKNGEKVRTFISLGMMASI